MISGDLTARPFIINRAKTKRRSARIEVLLDASTTIEACIDTETVCIINAFRSVRRNPNLSGRTPEQNQKKQKNLKIITKNINKIEEKKKNERKIELFEEILESYLE